MNEDLKTFILTGEMDPFTEDGGFLIPEFVWINSPGPKAWFLRTIGRLTRRSDWIEKGMECHNFYDGLTKILKERLKLL